MPEYIILKTLALIFVSALCAGVIARWLRQSVVLGYLVCGILIGPFGFNLISDTKSLQEYANIGVALLMFVIGLEFSFRELRTVRKIAVFGAHIQIFLTILLGMFIGIIMNWPVKVSIIVGCSMAISSTMVILNTLNDRGELSTIAGRIMVGMLIIQDLAVIVMTTIFPAFSNGGLGTVFPIHTTIFFLLAKATIIIFACIGLGRWVIPFILKEVSLLHSKQLFVLTSVAVALGTAYLTQKFGLTLSLGAFIAGLLIGNSKYSHAILAEISPLKDIFGILFFVSIGTLLDPVILGRHLTHLVIILLALIVGKFIICSFTALLFHYSGRVAVETGMGLIAIGEFSFVLVQVALEYNLISQEIYTLILAVAIFTTALTPLFFKIAIPFYEMLESLHFLPRISYLQARRLDHIKEEEMDQHVILCGYGRVGRYIGRALSHFEKGVLVIDSYPFRVEEAQRDGLATLYGDASKTALLLKAGIKKASLLIVAVPDVVTVNLIISEAKRLRHDIPVVVRFRDALDLGGVSHIPQLYPVLAEFEGALRMVRQTLILCRLDPRHYLSRLSKEVYGETSKLDE